MFLQYVFCYFLRYFTYLIRKGRKKLFQLQKIDFDQQTACGAPVCWSKYTTLQIWFWPSPVFQEIGPGQNQISTAFVFYKEIASQWLDDKILQTKLN